MSTSTDYFFKTFSNDGFVSRIFPPTCPFCFAGGEPGIDLCRDCLAELPMLQDICCSCAEHLPNKALPGAICGNCLAAPPFFDRTFAAFPYASPVDDLIRRLKFRRHLYCARILGRLLAMRAMRASVPLPDCFIPIPLHRQRLQRRGFNQSVEIVRALSRCLHVPFDHRCLRRVGTRAPQTALPADRRRRNPAGTFALTGTPQMRFVAIVDDVMTTGATVNEASRVLREAGIERVEVWVVARAHKGVSTGSG